MARNSLDRQILSFNQSKQNFRNISGNLEVYKEVKNYIEEYINNSRENNSKINGLENVNNSTYITSEKLFSKFCKTQVIKRFKEDFRKPGGYLETKIGMKEFIAEFKKYILEPIIHELYQKYKKPKLKKEKKNKNYKKEKKKTSLDRKIEDIYLEINSTFNHVEVKEFFENDLYSLQRFYEIVDPRINKLIEKANMKATSYLSNKFSREEFRNLSNELENIKTQVNHSWGHIDFPIIKNLIAKYESLEKIYDSKYN